MTQTPDVPKLEPIGTSGDGRRHYYDEQARQALVEACLQPGASLAGLALKAGVNANLLRKWVGKHRAKRDAAAAAPVTGGVPAAFIPVVEVEEVATRPAPRAESEPLPAPRQPARASQRPPLSSRVVAQLPNGVSVELECTGQDAALVTAMIETLGRCHVPARR
jgi:transposase